MIKEAWKRIYTIKGRDSRKPLPILVHSTEEARRWVEWTPAAQRLAAKFWPGPLTLVLRPTRDGQRLTQPEFETLAIRVPAHATTRDLIAASRIPWASTSANRSGEPELTDGSAAVEAFSGFADVVVDAGKTSGTVSTIIDATGKDIRVLREGAISSEEVRP